MNASGNHQAEKSDEMSPDAKSHEATVSGCKGPSVYGRNLGTLAQCPDGLPCQEDPHGRP
jgi:hypothetical protein